MQTNMCLVIQSVEDTSDWCSPHPCHISKPRLKALCLDRSEFKPQEVEGCLGHVADSARW